ncbi:unnamed protein product [Clonostachys rosea]|uniref:F-box domain-containing protein n=1 Tax=Bionectria ochroleuca TaxID=29856 RepID=A0ABY6V064_BIOOC|nr:unnamed protein product [Clonostachys rosea]
MPPGRTSSMSKAWLKDARQTLNEGGTLSGREIIDALVPALSDWDIVYLRRRIAELRSNPTAFAKFIDLSVDCIYLILPYLSISDFLAMRLVSSEWNKSLTQPALLVILCRVYFPGISTEKAMAAGTDFQKFLDIVRVYSRKRANMCGKMFIPWDIESHTMDINVSSVIRNDLTSEGGLRGKYLRHRISETVCADGKLVLLADRSFLLVDDLAQGTRMKLALYSDPRLTRRAMKVEAVTGRIIVMSSLPGPSHASITGLTDTTRLPKIHVYHFELKVWRDVSLPSRHDECFADNDKFVVTFHDKTAMLWTWAKGLVKLPVDDPTFHAQPLDSANLYRSVAGALFHPSDPNTVFLTWVYFWSEVDGGPTLFTTVVVRYNYNECRGRWEPTKDFRHQTSHPIPNPNHSNYCFGGQADPLCACYSRRSSKTSTDGMYLVALCFLVNYMGEQDNEGMCECVQPSWDKDHVRGIMFNVCLEKFYENRYYGYKDSWACNVRTILRKGRGASDQGTFDQVQVWNGEMFNMLNKVLGNGLTPVIESIRGRKEDGLLIATLSGDNAMETFTHNAPQRAFADGPYQLHVGTDYLVLAGLHGYSIWRWDKEGQRGSGKQPAGLNYPWLAVGEDVKPTMRHLDESSDEDMRKELHPPYAASRSQVYDKVVKLEHKCRDYAMEAIDE